MIAIKKLFNVNSKGFVSLVLASVFCAIFILPPKVEAGILDNIWNYVKPCHRYR